MFEQIDISDVKIVKSISNSASEIMPFLGETPELDTSLRDTIANIFDFIANLVGNQPDPSQYFHNQTSIKDELLSSLANISDIVSNLSGRNLEISDAWLECQFWLDNYFRAIDEVCNAKVEITSHN